MSNVKRYRACVSCGEPVRAPIPGTLAQAHRGHVDHVQDAECGVWGWEWRSRPEDDLEEEQAEA